MSTRHRSHSDIIQRYAIAGYRDPDNVHLAIVGKGHDRYMVSIPTSELERLLATRLFNEIRLRSEMTQAVKQQLVDQGFIKPSHKMAR